MDSVVANARAEQSFSGICIELSPAVLTGGRTRIDAGAE